MNSQERYQRIWKVVQTIPIGKVSTYGQIADLAGMPGRARLVGKSLGKVPEAGFNSKKVPWHRVLRSSGQIAFPIQSEHFERQRALLNSEGITVKGTRVPLKQFGWQPDLAELLFKLEF